MAQVVNTPGTDNKGENLMKTQTVEARPDAPAGKVLVDVIEDLNVALCEEWADGRDRAANGAAK